jgi:hypothetical protein
MTNIDTSLDDILGESASAPNLKEALAGDMPTMGEPENPVLTLPRGRFVGGKWETSAEVRELTGNDEEYLSRRRDPLDYFDAVLALGVTRLGSTDMGSLNVAEREQILSSLLGGERELLFLTVIRTTFGNERDLEFQCGSCQGEFTTTLLLDNDFPLVDTLGFDPPLTYEFTTSKGDTVEYRLVNGADQKEAATKRGATTAEQNTIVLTNVIRKVNGDLPFDLKDYVLGLSMKDRRDLINAMDERLPTINNEVDLECHSCGTKNRVTLNWGDLFRP